MVCADCGTEGQHRRGGGYCLERQLAAARAEAEQYLSAHEACVADLVRVGAAVDVLRLELAHTEALLEDREREIGRLQCDARPRSDAATGMSYRDLVVACRGDTHAALAAEGKDPKEGT